MSRNQIQLRSISLYGYKHFVEAAGGDPIALAEEANIPAHALNTYDVFIPLEDFVHLLELTAKALDNPTFGLDYAFSMPRSLPSLTPLSFLAYLSKDLTEWVNYCAQYLATHNYPNYVRHIIENKNGTTSMIISHNLHGLEYRHILEYNLALIYRLALQHVNSKHAHPLKVKLPFDLGDGIDKAKYEQVFNCPVEFNSKQCELILDIKVLAVKLDAEKTYLKNTIEQYLNFRTNGNARSTTTAEKVRMIIPIILGTGRCNLYNTARLLGIGTKTLQRQLEYEKTSFSEILDEQRQHLAKKLLNQTDKSSTAIAVLLDYGSLKAFSFAFKRWTGTTPSRFR